MAGDRFSFESVERAVRSKTFGVLTTIDSKGQPHSTGIIFGVSPPTSPFALYIIASENYAKVRNIKRNPQVSLVVTFPHYYIRFAPASYAMFRGKAEIRPYNDADGRWAMNQKRIQRMNVRNEAETAGVPMVFIKIVPEPTVFCYGLGYGIMKMRSDPTSLGYKVTIPKEKLSNAQTSVL
jgi:general stress protein 26